MRASLEELSGQSFLYVSGGHRGQDVLRHVLASSAWRPGLIAVVSDSVPLGAAAECDGVPVVAVPTEHTPDAWWAMAAHGIKGVLAVGFPPICLRNCPRKHSHWGSMVSKRACCPARPVQPPCTE